MVMEIKDPMEVVDGALIMGRGVRAPTLKQKMRWLKIYDPVIPGQVERRRYCLWIANHQCHRCPRPGMNDGQECWCRGYDPRIDDPNYPWRVVPPLTEPTAPGFDYSHYDRDIGPRLIRDEPGRAWLAKQREGK
jgi:hypothetical protein